MSQVAGACATSSSCTFQFDPASVSGDIGNIQSIGCPTLFLPDASLTTDNVSGSLVISEGTDSHYHVAFSMTLTVGPIPGDGGCVAEASTTTQAVSGAPGPVWNEDSSLAASGRRAPATSRMKVSTLRIEQVDLTP